MISFRQNRLKDIIPLYDRPELNCRIRALCHHATQTIESKHWKGSNDCVPKNGKACPRYLYAEWTKAEVYLNKILIHSFPTFHDMHRTGPQWKKNIPQPIRPTTKGECNSEPETLIGTGTQKASTDQVWQRGERQRVIVCHRSDRQIWDSDLFG